MTSHWSSPLTSQSLMQQDVILPHSSVSARHDLQLVVTLPQGISFRSRDWNDNPLEIHEIDICSPIFSIENCDNLGDLDSDVQENPSNRAGYPVGFGGMHKNDWIRHQIKPEGKDEGSILREPSFGCSDRYGAEGGTVEEADCRIEDSRQALIDFNVVYDESYLLAEAKRLREKNQGASSAVARWIAYELLRIAIAAAQVSVRSDCV